ncbi:hypothetical protein BG004_002352, partial [Podila humilis]
KKLNMPCAVCSEAVVLEHVSKMPKHIVTLQALDEEKLLLRNMDSQHCLDCGALLHNETMAARQRCVISRRVLCFICNRDWDAVTMLPRKNTCGKESVYETLARSGSWPSITMRILRFRIGAPDPRASVSAHTMTTPAQMCKHAFCFLCLEVESVCKRKYKSAYSHICLQAPFTQDCGMFPRLAIKA